MRITAAELIARLENDNLNQKENEEIGELRKELEKYPLEITDLDDEQFAHILTLLQSSGLSDAIIKLKISYNGLTAVPPEIGRLRALQNLFVENNLLTALPSEIGRLTALKSLNLSNNQLSVLPPEIGRLTALKRLNLSDNQLSVLPPEIGQLMALQNLFVDNSLLTALPSEIGRLTKLENLFVEENLLTALPSEIGRLTKLENLFVENNLLTALPSEIGRLTALQGLWLSNNQLSVLPPEIGQLTALQGLWLSYNRLTTLPPEIGQLTALQQLWLSQNRLTTLPSTVGNILDGLGQKYFELAANNLLEADKPSTIAELKVLWRSFQAAYRKTLQRTLEIQATFERLGVPAELAQFIAEFDFDEAGPDLQGLPPIESQILEESVNPDAKPRNKLKPHYEAIADNDVKKLSEILSDKDTPVDLDVQLKVGYKMRTLLHAAASKDVSSELTRLLLDEGANPNQVDSDGLTPVERAVLQGRTDILAVYQLFRCKIQDSTWEKAARQYPVIAKKCDPNIDYKELKNILDTGLVQRKITLKSNSDVQKEHIQKELSEARRAGNRGEVAKILKSNTNLDLNASGEGALLLFDATERNVPDIVSFLLEAGVDPNVTIVDDNAQLITAVHLATINGLKEVLQAYSDSGKVTLETWESVEQTLKHMFASNQTSARHDEYKEVREVIRVAKEKTQAKSEVTQTQKRAALTFFPRAKQKPFLPLVPHEPNAGVVVSAKSQPNATTRTASNPPTFLIATIKKSKILFV